MLMSIARTILLAVSRTIFTLIAYFIFKINSSSYLQLTKIDHICELLKIWRLRDHFPDRSFAAFFVVDGIWPPLVSERIVVAFSAERVDVLHRRAVHKTPDPGRLGIHLVCLVAAWDEVALAVVFV